MGTISYLSPKALAGREPDYSFDLWSLAVVLFECLAGRNPYFGATRQETMANIRGGTAPTLEREQATASLRSFLDRALAPEARRRPATAREFRDALDTMSRAAT